VHGARAFCVHRQVLRPREPGVICPSCEGQALAEPERPRLFLPYASAQLRLRQAVPSFGGAPRGAPVRRFPREFSRGGRNGFVRLGRSGSEGEDLRHFPVSTADPW